MMLKDVAYSSFSRRLQSQREHFSHEKPQSLTLMDLPPDTDLTAPRRYPTTGQPLRSRTSFKDLTGQRFGRWSVLAECPKTRPGQSKWHCRCDCGKEKPAVCYTSLTTGRSRSCGCLKTQLSSKPLHQQHGHVNPTYRSWHARRHLMPRYWLNNFDQFLKDM
jgi:hypothetical protein